jgi:hypothetical protein
METRSSGDSRGATPPIFGRFSFFEFLISSFALLLFACGCASPGEPYERKPPVPAAITDLTAAQSGNDVILTFTLPGETPDHRPLKQAPAIEIYRDFELAPQAGAPGSTPAASPALLATIPSAMTERYTEKGRVHYSDALSPEDFGQHPDSMVVYTVRTRVSEKKESAGSNAASVRIHAPLEPIADLHAELSRSAVALSWTAPEKTLSGVAAPVAGYHIYRAEAAPAASANSPNPAGPSAVPTLAAPLAKIGETDSTTFQDTQTALGRTYVYSVRSLAQYPDETLESADSNLAVITARDIFPPAAPQGLVAVFVQAQGETPAHVELSWAISPETDLAGYNVYRSEGGGTQGTRLNSELLLTPAFRDMNTLPGLRYFYSVTAVDRSGNESPPSVAVSSGVPGESPVP